MKNLISKIYSITGWFLPILVLCSQSASAQVDFPISNESSTDKCLSPYFQVLNNEDGLESMPLKSTQVEVNIAGVIANVQVTQVYTNTGTAPIEAIYVFPASTRAAVHGMVMKIGEREIVALVQDKTKARQLYNQAQQEGKVASLLEEHRPNVFQMNVANIMPGAIVEVILSYTELLVPTEKIYEFVYPTVVGPRYVNASLAENNSSENWTANPYLPEGQKTASTIDIEVNLSAGMPVKEAYCNTHQHKLTFKDKTNAMLKLEDPHGGNRDFVFKYRLAGNAIESGIMVFSDPQGENYFLAMVQPPKAIESAQIPPREYVFLVDVSGSMSGFPLEVSKTLIKNLLNGLKESDKFNIVFFAGSSSVYSQKSLEANSENISKAISFMEKQQGGGSTELLSALQTAMGLNYEENLSRSFVILTDGYISVEKESFEYIRQNLGKANFFAFGIGSSVNRYLMEGMAHVGYGEAFIAQNEEEAKKVARKFEKYISQPVLTNIEFQFKGFEAYDILPEKMPDLFSERPLIIIGKYKGATAGTLHIKGITGGQSYVQTLSLENLNKSENHALKYLWAREKVRLLADYSQVSNEPELQANITELGLKYNLLTAYTSFIAIDSEVSNASLQYSTVKQPLPLPEGVSNLAVVGYGTASAPSRSMSVARKESKTHNFYSEELTEENSFEFVVVEKMPEFEGGDLSHFVIYIQKQIQIPATFPKDSLPATVYLRFEVDETGTVSKVEIIRGAHPLLDQEAIRVMNNSPRWTPGSQNGNPVKTSFTIPIKFDY